VANTTSTRRTTIGAWQRQPPRREEGSNQCGSSLNHQHGCVSAAVDSLAEDRPHHRVNRPNEFLGQGRRRSDRPALPSGGRASNSSSGGSGRSQRHRQPRQRQDGLARLPTTDMDVKHRIRGPAGQFRAQGVWPDPRAALDHKQCAHNKRLASHNDAPSREHAPHATRAKRPHRAPNTDVGSGLRRATPHRGSQPPVRGSGTAASRIHI